ncbi:transporter [Edaphobacter sp. HDX4]|uniref:SphA family protein n=1 Tax=Edaphobacter sp. HDX4 TaxID=2794064 RepID=UPI002FE523A9
MSFGSFRRRQTSLVALIVSLIFAGRIEAQQNGHYLQGITGLDNGSGAPPGVYVAYLPYVNAINSFKGPSGQTLLNADLNVVAHNVAYQVTTHKKILGAEYGIAVIIPVVNTRVAFDALNTNVQEAGVSDLYFAPVVLGWEKGKANFLVNYGFYAPTGDYDPAKSLNKGLGFWEHQIQAGMSYSFDKKKLWNASVLSTWEINQSKTGQDLKAGPMMNVEYSLGHRFDQYKINLGAAGYVYHKLSEDSGSDASILGSRTLDRSFGIGPEFKYTNPMKHFGLSFRYERQFAVQSKTQGDVYAIGLTWLNIFPPSHH